MIEINEKNHQSALISSLEKVYNNGKLTGRLNSIDIYLLNIIYKLLNNCCIELTDIQKKILMDMYRNIYFHSEQICNTTSIEIYEHVYKTPFFQAEVDDCNTYPVADKIYYWQEQNYNTTIEDILLLVDDQDYFLNKSYDSKENFEIGKNITYNNIGRICFAITEYDDLENYEIFDTLNNNITTTFDFEFVESIKTLLIVSKNIYSNGDVKIKIKKQ